MKKILTLFMAAAIFFGVLTGCPKTAKADTEREFDTVNVLDDLTSSKDENGKAFDLTAYPYKESGSVQLVTLVEYCYSYTANMRQNYALYLYIYNPTGQEFDADSAMNKVQLAASYNEDGTPDDYELFDIKFCNKSTGDYNNLFYKYRIIDREGKDGKTIAERVNSNVRRYDISSVQLVRKGAGLADSYGCGGTYRYSGYAAGYGPDETAASTLTCEVTDLETIETTVRGTVYRPEGSFHNGEQDQLNSVFFSIPNYFFEEYGKISSIKARWDEYRTNPIFVTENAEAAKEYAQYAGKNIYDTEYTGYIGAWTNENTSGILIWYDYAWIYNLRGDNPNGIASRSSLTAVFDTEGKAYDEYTIGGEELLYRLLETSQSLGGNLINGKYSESLFTDAVDAGHTRGENVVTVDSNYEYSLTSYYLTQNFWQKIFGGTTEHSETYKNIKAIEEVSSADLLNKDDAAVSKELYIGEEDVQALRDEVAAAEKSDSRVVLFRFAVSKYYSYPVVYTAEYDDSTESGDNLGKLYRDGYVAEETVYLDFTVIQTTFYKEGVYTVISVVARPIDVIGSITPPLGTEIRGDLTSGGGTVLWVLAILAVAVIAIVLIISLLKSAMSRPKVEIHNSPSPTAEKKKKGGRDGPAERVRAERAASRAEQAARKAKQSETNARKTEREVKKHAYKQTGKAGGKAQSNTKVKTEGGKADGKAKGAADAGKNIRKR